MRIQSEPRQTKVLQFFDAAIFFFVALIFGFFYWLRLNGQEGVTLIARSIS